MLDLPAIDFKGEAITFRTTTAAVLDTVAHCVDLVSQREDSWHKRLDRELDRRRRVENLAKSYLEQLQKVHNVHPGPDLEVSQMNTINIPIKINGAKIIIQLYLLFAPTSYDDKSIELFMRQGKGQQVAATIAVR